MSKKLQKGSQYEQFDLDGDGIVSDEELSRSEHMIRLENSDKMQDQQRMLCWVSSISSIILIVLAMSPVIPDTRVEMVTALLSTYVVANLGIVATFMGTTAFTRSKENGKYLEIRKSMKKIKKCESLEKSKRWKIEGSIGDFRSC